RLDHLLDPGMVEGDLQLVAVDPLHRPHSELLVEHPVADRVPRRLRAVDGVALAVDHRRPAADRAAAAPQVARAAPGDATGGLPARAAGRRLVPIEGQAVAPPAAIAATPVAAAPIAATPVAPAGAVQPGLGDDLDMLGRQL